MMISWLSSAFLCYLSIKSRAFSQCNCWLSAAYPAMIMRRLLHSAFNLVSVKYFALIVSLLLLLFIVLSVWVMQWGKIKVIPQIWHLQNNSSLSRDGKCHLQAVLSCSWGPRKWDRGYVSGLLCWPALAQEAVHSGQLEAVPGVSQGPGLGAGRLLRVLAAGAPSLLLCVTLASPPAFCVKWSAVQSFHAECPLWTRVVPVGQLSFFFFFFF